MPVFVRRVKEGEWVATDASGQVFGRHPTKAKAAAQAREINAKTERTS